MPKYRIVARDYEQLTHGGETITEVNVDEARIMPSLTQWAERIRVGAQQKGVTVRTEITAEEHSFFGHAYLRDLLVGSMDIVLVSPRLRVTSAMSQTGEQVQAVQMTATAGPNPALFAVADDVTIEHELAHASICIFFGALPNYVSISRYSPCVAYPGNTPEKIGWENMRTVFLAGLAKEYLMGVAHKNDFFEPDGPFRGDYQLYTDFGGQDGAFEKEFWTAVCLLELETVMRMAQKMRGATWERNNLMGRVELARLFPTFIKEAHDAQGNRPF